MSILIAFSKTFQSFKMIIISLFMVLLLTGSGYGATEISGEKTANGQISNNNLVYTDLDGYWAQADINALQKNGVVVLNQLQDSGRLDPDRPISRAEYIRLVLDNTLQPSQLKEELDSIKTVSFTDDVSNLSAAYLEVARAHKFIQGYTDGTVNPDQSLTRAEMVTILMKTRNQPLSTANEPLGFTDLPANHWAAAYIKSALDDKIVSGYPDHTFKPDISANRAEALVVVKKYLEKDKLGELLKLAAELEVSTPKDEAVFYSGTGNRVLAEKYSKNSGNMTLEMTPGGHYLDDLRLFDNGSLITPSEATQVWSVLSRRYAQGASGMVHCFVKGARSTGVFKTVEYPELLKNEAVTRIDMENTGYIKVSGGKVWYEIVGADKPGIPLLTLHGGPGGTHDYLEPLEALAAERPVVFYDQLGGGESDHPDDPSLWKVERFVSELSQVRDALHLKKVHILGSSWGTMLATEYMLNKPEGVVSLVFSGPAISAQLFTKGARSYLSELSPVMQGAIDAGEASHNYTTPQYKAAVMEFYKKHLCRIDPWPDCVKRSSEKMGAAVYEQMWGPSEFTVTGTLKNFDLCDRLGEITIPTLFTCGRYDEATPEITKYYQSKLPGSEMYIFEDASHQHMAEKPEEFCKVVQDFLDRVEKSTEWGK